MTLRTTYMRHSRPAYAACSYVLESTVLTLLCWSEYTPMPSCLQSPLCQGGWRNNLASAQEQAHTAQYDPYRLSYVLSIISPQLKNRLIPHGISLTETKSGC